MEVDKDSWRLEVGRRRPNINKPKQDVTGNRGSTLPYFVCTNHTTHKTHCIKSYQSREDGFQNIRSDTRSCIRQFELLLPYHCSVSDSCPLVRSQHHHQYRNKRSFASWTTHCIPSCRFRPVIALHANIFHVCVLIVSRSRAYLWSDVLMPQ